MKTMTRRKTIGLIAAGLGASIGNVLTVGRLFAQAREKLPIATAGKGGFFYPLGGALAAVISKYSSAIEASPLVTKGAADNMRLLHGGEVELALAQGDVSWAASQGRLNGLPEKVAVRTLLGTTSGYLHVVTLDGLGIDKIAALKGRRVSTGERGSGTEVKSLRVLEASGVRPEDLGFHAHQDYPEAAQALKDGTLDAFTWDASLPGKAIVDLANTPGIKVRLLDTGAAVSAMVQAHGPFYFAAPIPKGTYPGMEGDVPAAVGKTLFVAHARMPESSAYEITKAALENLAEVSASFPAAREITQANAATGSPIPFHPGAIRYYKEKGIAIPSL